MRKHIIPFKKQQIMWNKHWLFRNRDGTHKNINIFLTKNRDIIGTNKTISLERTKQYKSIKGYIQCIKASKKVRYDRLPPPDVLNWGKWTIRNKC